LVQWAIEVAVQSALFDRIVVSTEDAEIAEVARALGPFVPFMRSEELAGDRVRVDQVTLGALDQLEAIGELYSSVCIMLPTCPLRAAADVQAAHDLFCERRQPNLMSVVEFEHTPFWARGLTKEGLVEPHFPECIDTRRQDLPAAYRPNGAIHILDVAWLQATRSYLVRPIIGFVMPRERSIDIDSVGDLAEAELMLARNRS
jgi:CMP-N-acetylneuraminic acid synthetase